MKDKLITIIFFLGFYLISAWVLKIYFDYKIALKNYTLDLIREESYQRNFTAE